MPAKPIQTGAIVSSTHAVDSFPGRVKYSSILEIYRTPKLIALSALLCG